MFRGLIIHHHLKERPVLQIWHGKVIDDHLRMMHGKESSKIFSTALDLGYVALNRFETSQFEGCSKQFDHVFIRIKNRYGLQHRASCTTEHFDSVFREIVNRILWLHSD